jgi:hypothetical protein
MQDINCDRDEVILVQSADIPRFYPANSLFSKYSDFIYYTFH